MKVCLASTADRRYCVEEVKKIRYMLESFYYIEDWQIPIIKKCDFFLLDSGAFTMFSKGHNLTEKDWDNYVDRYIEFIIKNDIKYFFELDVDRILGLEKVEEIRNKIEKETGKKCIPVWHRERGWEYFKKMCDEYEYVAIGGIAKNPDGKKIEKLFPKIIKYAHDHDCKIHGLGYTSTNKLPIYHFDSVDSTNWKSGGRFGSLQKFNGKNIITYSYKDKRAKNYKQIDIHNLREWIKYQDYAERYL